MEDLRGEKGQRLTALIALYVRYTREENIAQAAYVLNQILFIYGQDKRREQAVVLMLKGKTESNIDEHVEYYLPVFERHYSVGRFKHMLPQNLKEFGCAYSHVGAWEKSRKFLLRAKNLFEKIFGADHFYVSDVYLMLSEMCKKAGEDAESLIFLNRGSVLLEWCARDENVAREYRQMYKEAYDDSPAVVMAHTAFRFQNFGELPKAARLLEFALRIYESEKQPFYRCRMVVLGALIDIYQALEVYKDLRELRKLYDVMKKYVALYASVNLSETPQAGNLLAALGRICCGWERFAKAKEYFERSCATFEKCGKRESVEMREVLEDLAWVNKTLAQVAKGKKATFSPSFWNKLQRLAEERSATPSESSDECSATSSPRGPC